MEHNVNLVGFSIACFAYQFKIPLDTINSIIPNHKIRDEPLIITSDFISALNCLAAFLLSYLEGLRQNSVSFTKLTGTRIAKTIVLFVNFMIILI